MWDLVKEGNCLLIECPSRWYLGVVKSRNSITFTITKGLIAHNIGDTGLFLDGEISSSTELTPLPRDKEINLASVDSVDIYPEEYLDKIRKRTHQPMEKKESAADSSR